MNVALVSGSSSQRAISVVGFDGMVSNWILIFLTFMILLQITIAGYKP